MGSEMCIRDRAKRVKVVLTESITTLGRDGDVVEVAPGYARNFLLPFGKAANVTPSILKQIERKRAKEKIAAEKVKQEAIDFKTALATIGRFTIKKQVGEDGVLFGTVTNGDVAEAIEAATKKEIDRRHITCLLYTSPSPRDLSTSRMPSSA